MASNSTLAHLSKCDCTHCQKNPTAQPNEIQNLYKAVAAMPRERKDYFDESAYETDTDSDHGRLKQDEAVRKAPYLPRIQIWARNDGPYTMRVGHQWFHCDELVINGLEYKQKTRKPTVPQTPNQGVRRPASNRNQSYQRVRPDKEPASNRSSSSSFNREQESQRVAAQAQYSPQALPAPRQQAEKRRSERKRQKELEAPPDVPRSRRDSGVGTDVDAQSGQLVPYSKPPPAQTNRPPPQMKQARPVRPRQMSRGSSYQVPVRNKARKAVRFAAGTN